MGHCKSSLRPQTGLKCPKMTLLPVWWPLKLLWCMRNKMTPNAKSKNMVIGAKWHFPWHDPWNEWNTHNTWHSKPCSWSQNTRNDFSKGNKLSQKCLAVTWQSLGCYGHNGHMPVVERVTNWHNVPKSDSCCDMTSPWEVILGHDQPMRNHFGTWPAHMRNHFVTWPDHDKYFCDMTRPWEVILWHV